MIICGQFVVIRVEENHGHWRLHIPVLLSLAHVTLIAELGHALGLAEELVGLVGICLLYTELAYFTQEEVAELHRALADCENEAAVTHAGDERITYVVFFSHNSSYLDADEAERLHAFAQAFRGCRLSLLAEASTPGSREYNQALSERRLARVIDLLKGDGFSLDDLVPGYAIGEQNGIDTAEGRRVTITVESIQNDKNQ